MARARRSWVKRCDVRLSASTSYHAPRQWSARANRTFDDRAEHRARARQPRPRARHELADAARASTDDSTEVKSVSADIHIPSCK
jgi:hypothetical protein